MNRNFLLTMSMVALVSVAITCLAILIYAINSVPLPEPIRLNARGLPPNALPSEGVEAAMNRERPSISETNLSGTNATAKQLRPSQIEYMPREMVDSAGYNWVLGVVEPWPRTATLPEIAARFKGAIKRSIDALTRQAEDQSKPEDERAMVRFTRASFLNYEGDPVQAYDDLSMTRRWAESNPEEPGSSCTR